MTYCKKCGKELTNAEIRCPYCGEENTIFSTPSGENVVSHKRRNMIIIGIVAAVLVICAAGFIVLYNLRNDPVSILARAERYSTEQNFEQAINEFQRLIEIKPNNAAAYIGLADTYIGLEQPDKAVETLKTGLNETNDEGISTKLIDLLSECANKHLNGDNYEQAISAFEQIIEIDSQNTPAYMGIADSYTALKDNDSAIEILKTALEITGDDSIITELADLLLKSADKSLSEKNYEQAISDFEQTLEIDRKNVNAYVGLADSYTNLANTDKAIETLKTGFENTSDESIKAKLVELLSECANQNLTEKNYDKAAEQFTQVIEIDDKNVGAYIRLAESYTAANNADKAIGTLENGFEKTKEDSIKNKLVGLLTQSANRDLSERKWEHALTAFKKLTDINPKNAGAYIGIANAYIGLDQNDEAVKVLQEGYDETNNSSIRNKLVERLLVSANALPAEKSLTVFQRILKLDKTRKDAYMGLANAYIELGQEDKAVEILKAGYDETGNADIKNMLDELTYDIEVLDAVMYTTTEISVRTEPNISSEKVGSLEKGDAVNITGKANNGWYRISYNNEVCFVNGEYLSSSKPVEPPPVDTPPVSTAPVSTAPAGTAEALLNSVTLNPQKTGNELLDSLVESILSKITNDNMSTYEKVKACYDYAITNFSYGQTGENLGWGIKGWAYEVLVNNVGVCNHYSSAFAVMTRAIGLETYLQNGQTSSSKGGFTGHTWCTMVINGVPYLFDPQVEDNIAKGGAIYYYKFCKTYDSGTGKDNYIPRDSRYYLENEKAVNGDLLIEPGMYDSGWWMFF